MDYDEEAEEQGKRRLRKKLRKLRPHVMTDSSRQQRRRAVRSVKQERAGQAETIIRKLLKSFPDVQSDDGLSRVQAYIRWVNDSLERQEPVVLINEIRFKNVLASARGGQHVQKNRTAVVATHLPTTIRVRNEEQRNAEQNRAQAVEILSLKLEEHLELWKTLTDQDPRLSVNEKVMEMLAA